jgi:oligopeptide/dipeptide ABC transporter ATP-binding protein
LSAGTAADATPVVSVRDLQVRVGSSSGTVSPVRGVSFAVAPGTSLGIVGESGSGKSVTVRGLLGLLPRAFSTSGAAVIAGTDMITASERTRRQVLGRHVGVVLQDPQASLNPVVSIGGHLCEGMRHHGGLTRRQARARAAELLGSFGIRDPHGCLGRYPHELSGGMRQRVLIACALACEPALLVADEPTTALDVTVQAEILDVLRRQRAARSMAMILVSHDLDVVRSVADHILVMYAGQVVEHAPADVLHREMRMHYTRGMVDAVPRLSAPAHSRLDTIPGVPPRPEEVGPGCAFAARCPAARDRCHAENPPLTRAGPHHAFACWYPLPPPVSPRAGS